MTSRALAPATPLDRAAPAVFVMIWSTGFVGTKLGLPHAEPFTFLSLRFACAVTLLALLVLALRRPWPRSWAEVRRSLVSGVLLHATYLGGVFVAISLGLPAGVTALVVGLQPILTAALSSLLGEKVRGGAWLGLLLGFGGVTLVVLDKLVHNQHHLITPAALCAAGVALAGGTLGTLYQRRFCADIPLMSGTVVQYAATLPVMLALSFARETRQVEWTPEFVFALAWLVGPLSLGAVLLLLTLLQRGGATRTTSLFYLVPPLTALLSYLVFGETLGVLAMLGAVLVLIGVVLVVRQRPWPA